MMRTDLLPLGPEALMHFSNAGLVKRALRELAEGYRPTLSLDDAATLRACFSDGIQVDWPQGLSIGQSRCNCAAHGICRHRLIAVLAYRELVTDEASVATPMIESISDAQLRETLTPAVFKKAQQLRSGGIRVELSRHADGEPCDTARLPMATVRYWAGGNLAAARCDCLRGSACEHVALGIWAFQAAQGARSVQLGAPAAVQAVERIAFVAAVDTLLRLGVTQGSGVLGQALSHMREASRDAAWLTLLVADLERWAQAYARRSTRYDAADGVDLLAELALRLAACEQPGQAATVLGLGQSGETLLDRLRLMPLGARTSRDGVQRQTELVLVDQDTATRLVLCHDWQVPEGGDATAEALQRQREKLAPGVMLDMLVQGQLLAKAAARRPDGSLRLARGRSAPNQVLPQAADWDQLGPPVRYNTVAAMRHDASASPISALQPRHVARRFVVFTPASGILDIGYDPQTLTLLANVEDAKGGRLTLHRTHQSYLPWALDALAAGLQGRHGKLRHVAGVLSWQAGQPWLEPWALVCDELLVPDFANQPSGVLATLPLWQLPLANSRGPVAVLERLRRHLSTALHQGLAHGQNRWVAEGASVLKELELCGFSALAAALRPLAALPAGVARAEAWLQCLALLQLHRDAAVHATWQATE